MELPKSVLQPRVRAVRSWSIAALCVLPILTTQPSTAADEVKVASSLKGFWDTTMVQFGQERQMFAAEGINIDVVWTSGGSEILQAVISGAVDVGIGTGVMGVIGAYTKNAPIGIVANEFVGSSDLYYFVPADSPVKSIKDLNGKSLGIARAGSSSESVGSMLAKQAGITLKYIPAGGPASTMTMLMTKQVDVAWGVFPVFMDQIEAGKIRIVALGKDAPGISEQTTRVNIASKNMIENRPDVLRRFWRAYLKTIAHAYASEDIPKQWATMNNISLEMAKRVIAENFQKDLILPENIKSISLSVEEALVNKYIPKLLTAGETERMLGLVAKFTR